MSVPPADTESIERATLAAVGPERVEALPGWLLPMDHGTVGRAHAAVPLQHDLADIAPWQAVAERYRAAGHRPVFRLPETPTFAAMQAELAAGGWHRAQPTQVQVAPLGGLLAAGLLSALLVRRQVDQLDLVAVLKVRE